MTSRTSWTAGNGVGYTWTLAFASGDAGTMVNADAVLSSQGDITNQTAQDIFCDLSVNCTIASSTVAAGANIAFWIYALGQNGTTYGDGGLTAGTPAAHIPAFPPCAVLPLFAAASQTTLAGVLTGIVIPPGTFRFVCGNSSGFTFTAAAIYYRTYNTNLND